MKRLATLLVLTAIAIGIRAQRVTKSYADTPLPKALAELNDMQDDYRISFIYDDLRDFAVNADIRRANALDAVRQMIGLYNIKVHVVERTILVECGEIGHRLKGYVVDRKGNPVSFANIMLMSLNDSTYITGGVSDEQGRFVVPCAADVALMRVSCVGLKTLTRVVNMTDIGTITMDTDETLLGEVVVKSQMPKTRLVGDAMVTNVAGTILERAGTAEQLLNQLPSVTAKDGKVTVFGRGTPVVYVNGRRVREQGALDRLSSEDIKKVELITNPGARYEATTTSVIRITTKPKKGDGLSFYSRTRAGREESGLWRGLESVTLNYRKSGLDIGGTLYYFQQSQRDDKNSCSYTMLDKTWENHLKIRQRYNIKDFYAKLTASYAFDDDNSIGASVSYDRVPEMPFAGSADATVSEDGTLAESLFSTYTSGEQRTDWNGNIYYTGKIGDVAIDFNTDWYQGKKAEWMTTNETADDATTTIVDTETSTRNRLLASKLVLTAPLLGGELSVGGEYSHSKRNSLYNVMPKSIIDDDDSRIEEGMASAFAEWSKTLGKLSLKAGLRYEYVDFNYYDHGTRIAEQSRTFSDFFPSLSLTMPVGKVQMMLSYSTDVSRPTYWMLRSSTTYANRYTYERGNPFLVPQSRSNLEYTLTYKCLTYQAMFSHMKNPMLSSGDIYNDQPGTIVVSYANGNSYNLFYTRASLSPKFGIWSPMLSVWIMKQWLTLATFDGNSINNPKATFRFNNTVETKLCDITLAMTAQTTGGDMNEYFRDGYFNADLTLRRSLMDNRLTLQLDIDNLFHSGERTIRTYFGSLQGFEMRPLHQQLVTLTARYSLNVSKSKYKGTGAGQSQKSRM